MLGFLGQPKVIQRSPSWDYIFSTRQSISCFPPLSDKSTKAQGSSFTPGRGLKICAAHHYGPLYLNIQAEWIRALHHRFLITAFHVMLRLSAWMSILILGFLDEMSALRMLDASHMKPYFCVILFQPTALPPQNFSMHVAVPVTNPNAMSYNPGASLSSQSLSAAAAASLSDGAMLSPPQGSMHRSVVPPQRPPSTGSTGECNIHSFH